MKRLEHTPESLCGHRALLGIEALVRGADAGIAGYRHAPDGRDETHVVVGSRVGHEVAAWVAEIPGEAIEIARDVAGRTSGIAVL